MSAGKARQDATVKARARVADGAAETSAALGAHLALIEAPGRIIIAERLAEL